MAGEEYLPRYVHVADETLRQIVADALSPEVLKLRYLSEIVRSSDGWIVVLQADLIALSKEPI